MIRPQDCELAEYVVTEFGADEAFSAAMQGPSTRGRPRKLDESVFLYGLFLAVYVHAQAHIRTIYRVLTTEIPEEWQVRWGIREQSPTPTRAGRCLITEKDLQYLARRFDELNDYSPGRLAWRGIDDPTGDVAERRKAQVHAVTDALTQAANLPRPVGARDYAVDASGIHANDRRPRKPPEVAAEVDPVENMIGADDDLEPQGPEPLEDEETDEERQAVTEPANTRNGPSDASWGAKTRKDGTTEGFYGFEVHAITRVPEPTPKGVPRAEAPTAEIIRISPAGTDVVDITLDMIDIIQKRNGPIRYLMSDRHYSYKAIERWLLPLIGRGVKPVHDLRKDQLNAVTHNGVLIAAGTVHCPRTPAHLFGVTRPVAYESTDPESTRSAKAKKFLKVIEQREAYAAQRINPLNAEGVSRWRCPARNGTVRCPLVPESMRANPGAPLPVIVNPPPEGQQPELCRQETMTLKLDSPVLRVAMKAHQKVYWGTRKWLSLWNLRTYVEGWFGTLKGDNAGRKRRGSSLYKSLPLISLELAMFTARTNIIQLRAWHKETGLGDPMHPLLREETRIFRIIYLDPPEDAPHLRAVGQ